MLRKALVIGLEDGGHMITHPFPKDRSTRIKIDNNTNHKVRVTRLDVANIFCPTEQEDEF